MAHAPLKWRLLVLETMFGDVVKVVNPEDPRYKDLIGKNAVLPIAKLIPIAADEHADPEFGTGENHTCPRSKRLSWLSTS